MSKPASSNSDFKGFQVLRIFVEENFQSGKFRFIYRFILLIPSIIFLRIFIKSFPKIYNNPSQLIITPLSFRKYYSKLPYNLHIFRYCTFLICMHFYFLYSPLSTFLTFLIMLDFLYYFNFAYKLIHQKARESRKPLQNQVYLQYYSASYLHSLL